MKMESFPKAVGLVCLVTMPRTREFLQISGDFICCITDLNRKYDNIKSTFE